MELNMQLIVNSFHLNIKQSRLNMFKTMSSKRKNTVACFFFFFSFPFFWAFPDPCFIFAEAMRPFWSLQNLARGILVWWEVSLNNYEDPDFQPSLGLKPFVSNSSWWGTLFTNYSKRFMPETELIAIVSGHKLLWRNFLEMEVSDCPSSWRKHDTEIEPLHSLDHSGIDWSMADCWL